MLMDKINKKNLDKLFLLILVVYLLVSYLVISKIDTS